MHDPQSHEIFSGVVPDWSDTRDAIFIPTSTATLPETFELEEYRSLADPAWHQRGQECTGFALAAIANYSVRKKQQNGNLPSVSRRMLYEMAQRFDGEAHVEGSTLRGALKGWSRVGVAADDLWPYDPGDEHGVVHGGLTLRRVLDGRLRPLLKYERIDDERIDTMQRALAEGHALYVASNTHVGWYRLFLGAADRVIDERIDDEARGIHAYVIVGYDQQGFWLHNSWGPEWGDEGYALLPYEQWRQGAVDAWIVDAGFETPPAVTAAGSAPVDSAPADQIYRDLWQHLVVLRDDGELASSDRYEMDAGSVKTLLYLFDEFTCSAGWQNRKLVVVVDGGELSTEQTIERFAGLRDELLAAQMYPIFVLWETEWLLEMEQELQTWLHYRAAPSNDEPCLIDVQIAAAESGARAIWKEVEARADRATSAAQGGANLLMQSIAYKRNQRPFDLHLVSFGAGDLLASRLAVLLPSPITSAIAIAPPTTNEHFHRTYGDMLADGCLTHQTIMTSTSNEQPRDRPFAIATTLLRLVSEVWSLPGSTMRQAGRNALHSRSWDPSPVPLLGLNPHDDRTLNALRSSGRLETTSLDRDYVELISTSASHEVLVSLLLEEHDVRVAPLGGSHDNAPRDPLAAAEFFHRAAQKGVRAQ